MFEAYGAPLFVIGIFAMVFSLLWAVIRAFRFSTAWGFAAATGIGLPFFVHRHAKQIRFPIVAFVVGFLLFAVPLAYNRFAPPDLGPREKIVDGELHITLTGWNPDKTGFRRWVSWLNVELVGRDRLDYSMLLGKSDTVVLQMANGDVGDGTLDYLAGMSKLRELDLNDTKVTDAGLAKLAKLQKLASLRLRGCQITDQGFRTHLMPLVELKQLELAGTAVTPAAVQEWKSAKPGRRALQ